MFKGLRILELKFTIKQSEIIRLNNIKVRPSSRARYPDGSETLDDYRMRFDCFGQDLLSNLDNNIGYELHLRRLRAAGTSGLFIVMRSSMQVRLYRFPKQLVSM